MGKHVSACGGRDSRRHHVLRWGSLIGPRSAAHLGTRQTGEPRGNLGLGSKTLNEKYYVKVYTMMDVKSLV